jgi:hypothetical protein
MTDLLLEEEDEEVQKIEGLKTAKWRNMLLPILYTLVPEDCE